MGSIIKKIFTFLILPAGILYLGYLTFESIAEPVRFNDEVNRRKGEAVQMLKDIRTLQEAHRDAYGYYAVSMDSLQIFYNEGKMISDVKIGNHDDSLAVANTNKYIKENFSKYARAKGLRRTTDLDKQNMLYEAYLADTTLNIVCSVPKELLVKEILFTDRPDFKVENLRYIPYSDGDTVIMKTVLKETQGVKMPLLEARIPFKSLLNGLDEQLVVNKIAEETDKDLYPGYKVGDVEKANNNAGNWE